jgi:hypothetical protein
VSAPLAITRWWQPDDRDWVSMAQGGDDPTATALGSRNYQAQPTPQFYAYLIGNDDMVAVYRWWQPDDRDWVTISEGSVSDDQMVRWGYVNKTFQYYAWRSQQPGTLPVYRWWQPSDRDWVTLVDGEISDERLIAWGYAKYPVPLFYATPARPTTSGYFQLSAPQTALTQSGWDTEPPHTLSVIEANLGGHRYWGYYGHIAEGGVGIVYSEDLQSWQQDPDPLFIDQGQRWPSALYVDGTVEIVYCTYFDASIQSRTSRDGKTFSPPVELVAQEPSTNNGNPTLFRDPIGGKTYLYWFRRGPDGVSEIRVKSAETFDGLAAAAATRIAYSHSVVAAPQVMYRDGLYYLATEAHENIDPVTTEQVWTTRVLVSDRPDGGFAEIPGNPILVGDACFFQHVFDSDPSTLRTYSCRQTIPEQASLWTVAYRTADLRTLH